MLDILFNSEWLYIILGAIVLIALIYLIFKFPQSRIYVFSFLGIALLGLTAYCGIQLNYYNSSGGIFGAITGIFDTNVIEVEDLEFSLKNIEMTETSEGLHSARVVSNEVVSSLSVGEEYTVTINNQPCSNVVYASDYVSATYEYSFYDENKIELCRDTLNINIAFYEKGTYLSVSTYGGANAVKYWNYYFQKEDFSVKIAISEYKSINYAYVEGEYEPEDYIVFNFYVEDEKVDFQVYKNGLVYLTPPECEMENFYCWSLTPQEDDWEKVSFSLQPFIKSANFYAIFLEDHTINYISQDNLVYTETVKTGFTPTYTDEPSRFDYTFVGWSIDGLNVVDMTNYIVEGDVEFIALWTTKTVTLTVENLVSGSGVENITLLVHASTVLTPPENITCKNGTSNFSHWEVISGDGVVVGNQFTAGSNNCVVSAIYDKAIIKVTCSDSCSINYQGVSYDLSTISGSTRVSAKFCCNVTDSMTITVASSLYSVNCEDFSATVVNNGDLSYTVSWSEKSLVKLTVNKGASAL